MEEYDGSKKKNIILTILLVLLSLAAIILVYLEVTDLFDPLQKQLKGFKTLDSQANVLNLGVTQPETIDEFLQAKPKVSISDPDRIKLQQKKSKANVDFNKLKSINEDIIYWLEIPSLDIYQPIVQDSSQYYQSHDILGDSSAIGVSYINNTIFDDKLIHIKATFWNSNISLGKLASAYKTRNLSHEAKLFDGKSSKTYKLVGISKANTSLTFVGDYNQWSKDYYNSHGEMYRSFTFNEGSNSMIIELIDINNQDRIIAYFQEV